MEKVYVLALWGNRQASLGWSEWFRFIENASEVLGSPLTHFGVKGDGLGTRNIRPFSAFRKLQAVLETSTVEWLSGYSLPKDYQTAVFDYYVHISLCSSYASLCVKERFAEPLLTDPDKWKREVSRFCFCDRASLFRVDASESPLLYISGSAALEEIGSLILIKEWR